VLDRLSSGGKVREAEGGMDTPSLEWKLVSVFLLTDGTSLNSTLVRLWL
jgi:hypothetical protein